jgi:hypothetical protein
MKCFFRDLNGSSILEVTLNKSPWKVPAYSALTLTAWGPLEVSFISKDTRSNF